MKTFSYSGYRSGGQSVQGLIEALDLKGAREQLVQQGIFARQVEATHEASIQQRGWGRQGMPIAVRAQVFREWALLLKAGNSLNRSIELLMDAPEFAKEHAALARVRDLVRDGESLSSALEGIADRWKPFEQAILEVGERTGQLGESLLTVADYLEDDLNLREKTMTALLYPALVIGVAVLIVGISCTWLLPSFQNTVEEAGLHIPVWAGWMIVAGRWGSIFILAAVSLAMIGFRGARNKATGNAVFMNRFESMGERIPGVRSYLEALYVNRYCQSLAILLKSGVPLLEACPMAGLASGSVRIAQSGDAVREQIRQGDSLAHAVSTMPWLQNGLPGWLRAGEESGALVDVLTQASDRAARRADRLRERFLRMLEPLLIALIGLFVMAMSFGLMAPILSMNELLSQ